MLVPLYAGRSIGATVTMQIAEVRNKRWKPTMSEHIFHLALSATDLYFDKHIGLQLAVELHDEMLINISNDKHRLSVIFNSGAT